MHQIHLPVTEVAASRRLTLHIKGTRCHATVPFWVFCQPCDSGIISISKCQNNLASTIRVSAVVNLVTIMLAKPLNFFRLETHLLPKHVLGP